MEKIYGSFFAGVLVTAGLRGSLQAWRGLEGYITYLRANWVEMSWGVPAACVVVGILLMFLCTFNSKGRL